jgi:hypothetical protein
LSINTIEVGSALSNYDSYYEVWNNAETEDCPVCRGTGLDRDELYDCEYCYGEGELPVLTETFPEALTAGPVGAMLAE